MTTLQVEVEEFDRFQIDEYGNVNVQTVKRFTDADGNQVAPDQYHRRVVGWDPDIKDEPKEVKDVVLVARRPERVARGQSRR